MQRHLTVLQLSRYVGIHHEVSASQRLEFVAELGRHYDAGLQLGELWLLLTTGGPGKGKGSLISIALYYELCVNEASHSCTCHPHVYTQVK